MANKLHKEENNLMVKSYYKDDIELIPFRNIVSMSIFGSGNITLYMINNTQLDFNNVEKSKLIVNMYTAWLDAQEAIQQESFNRGKRLLTKLDGIKTSIYNIAHQLETMNSDIVED
jgi:hypothetical protein